LGAILDPEPKVPKLEDAGVVLRDSEGKDVGQRNFSPTVRDE